LSSAGFGIEVLSESGNLLECEQGQAVASAGLAVLGPLRRGRLGGGFGGSRSLLETDGHEAGGVIGERDDGGELQYALSANEVGLEVRAEGIAAPGDTGDAESGFGQQGIIDGDDEGICRGQFGEQVSADDGEQFGGGDAVGGEEAIGGGPILELEAGGGQQGSECMAAEAEQAAQGEGLGAEGEALLGEGWAAVLEEVEEGGEDACGVFFSKPAGGWRRRRARSPLSSTDHSTVSPRENSMA